MTQLDKDNVISIFQHIKNENTQHDRILEILKTEDEDFQILIENYQKAKVLDDRIERRACAIEILRYEIHNPIEFVIKISILQNELGFREGLRTQDIIIDELMFTLFKKSLIGCVETLLFKDTN